MESSMSIKIRKECHQTKSSNQIINLPITSEEIIMSINKTKNKKAPDQIINEMLKKGLHYITPYLTDIFNEILQGSDIPNQWNLANIASIYKGKGLNTDINNQRGISMTSSIMKVLEKIIAKRISPVIKQNSTLLQGGGKEGESTEDYLLIIQTTIEKNKHLGFNTKMIITCLKDLRPNLESGCIF